MDMRMRGRGRTTGPAPALESKDYVVRRRTEMIPPGTRERGERVRLSERQAEHPLRQAVICTPEAWEAELAAEAAPAEPAAGESEGGRARGES